MHGLAAALIVTLNVLLAASPATGARAPTHTHSRAGKLFSLASVSQKTRTRRTLLEKANTLQGQKT